VSVSAPGALAGLEITDERPRIVGIQDWVGRGTAEATLREFWEEWEGRCLAVIEKQWASGRDRNKAVSVSKLVGNYEFYVGLLRGIGIPAVEVAPRTWQAAMLSEFHGTTKTQSLLRARHFYGKKPWFKNKKNHGRADAVNIAEYYGRERGKR